MTTKPVCVPCQRFFSPKRNGFAFVEGMPAPGVQNPPRGKEAPEAWKPYKLWRGDLWECKGCGAQLILSAREPVAYHHEPQFPALVKDMNAKLQVNDC